MSYVHTNMSYVHTVMSYFTHFGIVALTEDRTTSLPATSFFLPEAAF